MRGRARTQRSLEMNTSMFLTISPVLKELYSAVNNSLLKEWASRNVGDIGRKRERFSLIRQGMSRWHGRSTSSLSSVIFAGEKKNAWAQPWSRKKWHSPWIETHSQVVSSYEWISCISVSYFRIDLCKSDHRIHLLDGLGREESSGHSQLMGLLVEKNLIHHKDSSDRTIWSDEKVDAFIFFLSPVINHVSFIFTIVLRVDKNIVILCTRGRIAIRKWMPRWVTSLPFDPS